MGRAGNGRKCYSANPSDYKLLEEVGHGSSATVCRAIYLPLNDVVAIKCLDLDRCNNSLDDIQKEAQTMSLIDHPNVVRAYCSFVVERNLWVAMPFMSEGSCLHLMKIAYPDGFHEAAICSILKETLKALEYLHQLDQIHRDVKAGNILLDGNGAVKLADFGVSACMFDGGDRKRARNTFVGTPCWMAPEILQPGSGYDFKADIWSFGITALELAHGHAPFSKYPPMKVLLMILQQAPPALDYDRDKKFSRSFNEMISACLLKEQTKRPTASKLLKHCFFKHAKPSELSLKKLFADLPPLWNCVKALQLKDAEQLALKKMPSAEEEALSQSEYKRGVSAWLFDVNNLKILASAVQDDEGIKEVRDRKTIKFSFIDKDASDSKSSCGTSVSTRCDYEAPALRTNCEMRRPPSFGGPLMLPNRASVNSLSAPMKPSGGFRDSLEDRSKANLVQIKGRFSVTSEIVDLSKDTPLCTAPQGSTQGSLLKKSASVGDWAFDSKLMPVSQSPKEFSNSSLPASSMTPDL